MATPTVKTSTKTRNTVHLPAKSDIVASAATFSRSLFGNAAARKGQIVANKATKEIRDIALGYASKEVITTADKKELSALDAACFEVMASLEQGESWAKRHLMAVAAFQLAGGKLTESGK